MFFSRVVWITGVETVIGYCLLVLFCVLIPLLMGLPWIRVIKTKTALSFAYSCGFFIELAIFHIVSMMPNLLKSHFQITVVLYTVVVVSYCIVCIIYMRRNHQFYEIRHYIKPPKFNWLEWIFFLSIICTIGVQLVRGLTYDITYMSYDDVAYTPIATDALENGYVATVDPYTGESMNLFVQRALQTSLVFPAYLSAISGIAVATIEHTIQYLQFICLAYITCAYLAGELFHNRENRLIFLLLIAVFYWFGYHSHYSLTFRLLGPNYQGKAVLAVSLTPLIFTILIKELDEPYRKEVGILLFLLSLAGVSLTLWSCGTLMAIISIPIILSLFRKERNWRHLRYMIWGCIAPIGFSILYIIIKYVN